MAVKGWPKLVNYFVSTLGFALSKFYEKNQAISVCEADSLGALSMLIANWLSGAHFFMGDLVSAIS
jgi:L-fucose isomerase-like protein